MFFQTNPIITISFNGESNRPKKVVKISNKGNDTDELLIYGGQENVTGHVDIMIPPGKKIEHLGVKIEMYYHYQYYYYHYPYTNTNNTNTNTNTTTITTPPSSPSPSPPPLLFCFSSITPTLIQQQQSLLRYYNQYNTNNYYKDWTH
jgi:hypothetical protein